jgi:hypothetical protein
MLGLYGYADVGVRYRLYCEARCLCFGSSHDTLCCHPSSSPTCPSTSPPSPTPLPLSPTMSTMLHGPSTLMGPITRLRSVLRFQNVALSTLPSQCCGFVLSGSIQPTSKSTRTSPMPRLCFGWLGCAGPMCIRAYASSNRSTSGSAPCPVSGW